MNKLLKKIRKSIPYVCKLLVDPRKKEMWDLITHVKYPYRLRALDAFVDNRPYGVELKGGLIPQDIFTFLEGMQCRQEEVAKNIYRWKLKGKSICATHVQLLGLQYEYLNGIFDKIYSYDWKNKTVLDIGSFVGDSALFFFEHGAKKVISYEPVPTNFESLKCNVEEFGDKAEIHQKAISKCDGLVTLTSIFPEGCMGFGLQGGSHEVTCQGISFHSLLKQHRADVIKIDIEGAEQFLLDLNVNDFKSIPYWIVETHTKELYREIMKKFLDSGFLCIKEVSMGDKTDLIHFQLRGA